MLIIIEGLVMSFWLLLICVVGIAKEGPIGLVNFYEQDVQDRVVEIGLTTKERIRKAATISGIALVLPLITVVPAVVYLYNGVTGFWDGFIQQLTLIKEVYTGGFSMPKGFNQKLKLSYLCKIMQQKTDDEHSLTLQQIMHELEEEGISAERKSLYDDFAVMNEKLIPKKDGELYKVSPWFLAMEDENYYLVAYDSKASKIKHYRIDKMLKINMTEDRREGADLFKNFDMGEYALENFSMFHGKKRRVHIEFPNDMVGIFIDRFGKDVTIRPASDGRSFVAVDVAVSAQFFGWVFALGKDVKITGPDDVVEEFKKYLNDLMEMYK